MGIDIVNFYETEFYEKYPVISHVDENYLLNFPRRQPGWLLFASICKTIIPDFNFMKTVIGIIAFYVVILINSRPKLRCGGILTGVAFQASARPIIPAGGWSKNLL